MFYTIYKIFVIADDCFELGRQSYNNKDFYHTVLWMQEALRKHETEQNETIISKWEILEYLAYSLYMLGIHLYILFMNFVLISLFVTLSFLDLSDDASFDY